MSENIRVNDFMLTADEISAIDERAKLGERERFTTEIIGLEDEFDFSYEECCPEINNRFRRTSQS